MSNLNRKKAIRRNRGSLPAEEVSVSVDFSDAQTFTSASLDDTSAFEFQTRWGKFDCSQQEDLLNFMHYLRIYWDYQHIDEEDGIYYDPNDVQDFATAAVMFASAYDKGVLGCPCDISLGNLRNFMDETLGLIESLDKEVRPVQEAYTIKCFLRSYPPKNGAYLIPA